MNKEDFVSLECAKMLKEKGYDEPCCAYYSLYEDGDEINEDMAFEGANGWVFINSINRYRVGAPTLYDAAKWLRNKHFIHLQLTFMYGNMWSYDINTMSMMEIIGIADVERPEYDTYEEALNAGIMEALKFR